MLQSSANALKKTRQMDQHAEDVYWILQFDSDKFLLEIGFWIGTTQHLMFTLTSHLHLKWTCQLHYRVEEKARGLE